MGRSRGRSADGTEDRLRAADIPPRMNVLQSSHRTIQNHLAYAIEVRVRVSLRPDLRGQFVLLGQPVRANHAGFFHGVGQRLLAVHVHVAVQSPIGDERMRVIGGAANHGVDVFLLQALAPVDVVFRARELFGCLGEVLFVDVAQRNHILAFDGTEVSPSPAPRADQSDIQLVAGGTGTPQHTTGQDRQSNPGCHRRLQKLPSSNCAAIGSEFTRSIHRTGSLWRMRKIRASSGKRVVYGAPAGPDSRWLGRRTEPRPRHVGPSITSHQSGTVRIVVPRVARCNQPRTGRRKRPTSLTPLWGRALPRLLYPLLAGGNRFHAGVWLVSRREFTPTCRIVDAEEFA